MFILLMVQTSQTTTVWMLLKPVVNNGIFTISTDCRKLRSFWDIFTFLRGEIAGSTSRVVFMFFFLLVCKCLPASFQC